MNKAIVDIQQKANETQVYMYSEEGRGRGGEERGGGERREGEERRREGEERRGEERRREGEEGRGEEGADHDLQSVEPLPISMCDSSLAT